MIKTSHDQTGWTATDSNGNKATATFDEGESKAIERCSELAESKEVGKLNKKDKGKSLDVGNNKGYGV